MLISTLHPNFSRLSRVSRRFLRAATLPHRFSSNYARNVSRIGEFIVTEQFGDHIFLIGIDRPEKRNFLNAKALEELTQAFEQFESSTSLYAAVLYGTGGCFCSGFDLTDETPETFVKLLHRSRFRPMGHSPMTFSKPVIAAIDGYAIGFGLELACMCDARLIEENAIIGCVHRRTGLPLVDGGTVRLQKIMCFSAALDLILTGKPVAGREAVRLGLCSRLVGIGTVLGQSVHFAAQLIRNPQSSLLADRASAYYAAFEAKNAQDAYNFELRNSLPLVSEVAIATQIAEMNEALRTRGKKNILYSPEGESNVTPISLYSTNEENEELSELGTSRSDC